LTKTIVRSFTVVHEELLATQQEAGHAVLTRHFSQIPIARRNAHESRPAATFAKRSQ
jgi:hypothetical protein